MAELTEAQAKEAFLAMDEQDLINLAEQQGLPVGGVDKNGLINMLLGKCPSCKGNKDSGLTVQYISRTGQTQVLSNKTQEQPCLTCGQK